MFVKPHLRLSSSASLEETSACELPIERVKSWETGPATDAGNGLWPTASKKMKPWLYSCIEVNSATT